jgi:hypothetical protein
MSSFYPAYPQEVVENHWIQNNPKFLNHLKTYKEALVLLSLKERLLSAFNNNELQRLMTWEEYSEMGKILEKLFKICARINLLDPNPEAFEVLSDELYNYREYFKQYDLVIFHMAKSVLYFDVSLSTAGKKALKINKNTSYSKVSRPVDDQEVLLDLKILTKIMEDILKIFKTKDFNIYAMIEEAQYGNKTTPNH